MDREELEYAISYPFTSKAKKVVEQTGFNLDDPPLEVLDRAKQRIEENIRGSFEPVKSSSEKILLTELFSYPVAKILASLTTDYSLIQRFSRGEAARLSRHLLNDPHRLSEIAKELGINISENQISFADYVKAAPEKYPLVNAPLKQGVIQIDDRILPEIIANTLRSKLSQELSKKINVPQVYSKQASAFKKELLSFTTEDLGPLKIEAFPPCINTLINQAKLGSPMPHQPRFVLSSFLVNTGMPTENIVRLFANTPNFNENKTRYYVEYSAGKRGSGIKYTPPSCKKMDFYSLCRNKDALCNSIHHPLSYYSRKKRDKK
ncbi:hypothetical protein K8R43_01430 [archaeon]|nr:hypothetical protein [archaeon]